MFWRNTIYVMVSAVMLFYATPLFASTAADFTQITGTREEDYFASSLATGDFNNDGYQDVVAGSYSDHSNSTQNGAVYIFYGSRTAVATGAVGTVADVTYFGEALYDWSGYKVSSGDFNNDGYDDILIGSLFYTTDNGNTGAAYVIYGQAETLTGGSLSTAIRFTGAGALDEFGYAVSSVGDINNDGYDDMMMGAPTNDANGENAGAVYLVYGQAEHYTSGVITGVALRIAGNTPNDHLGFLVAPAGDINNDGYDDVLLGAGGVDGTANNAGAVYIMYGQSDAYSNPLTANNFVQLNGEAEEDQLGYSGSGVGDINNDGYDDMVIGSPYYGDDDTGAMYVFYGSDTLLTNGSVTQGVRITGTASAGQFGYRIGFAGDIDGDGNEFYVSSPYNNTYGADTGAIDLVWGGTTELTAGSLSSMVVYTEFGGTDAGENFGMAFTAADSNGDGYRELWASAPSNNDAASLAGALYVGYMAIDLDDDGVLANTGLALSSEDCNDDDADISSEQTYYQDADEDGLGENDNTIDVCVSTAPVGYVDNSSDTNDTIANNGVEIDGDNIDNDGDGVVDEVNTVAENSQHPGYMNVDPTDTVAVSDAIVQVQSTKKGKLKVTYADQSVYVYSVFKGKSTGRLVLKKYLDTGYYAVMQKNGRKLVLVNVLNGEKKTTVRKIPGSTYTHHSIQFTQLRSKAHRDIVITSKQGDEVRLYVAELNLAKNKFKYNAIAKLRAPRVSIKRTNIIDNTIDLRSNQAPLASYLVNKAHQLIKL